ncbi:hypothetical protein DF185_01175 [Marinifilum breve]|uniref:Yip1 domain-containing protein n=1 Tax=Marinifilum breve TaxID=2184082 RepID=A0A2V4A218_9BACT|nr:YIP1 family protein [Marinifilum breve]PXY02736.1 hypothetical protein DF185_01175 [Marinifilum breve]
MPTVFSILFNTKMTFKKLNNKFADELSGYGDIIFMIYGILIGLDSVFRDYPYFNESGLGILLFVILLSIAVSVIVGRYILPYITLFFGKLLKGQAEYIDIKTVFAYSLIPTLIKLCILIPLYFNIENIQTYTYFLNIFNLAFYMISIKILIQGLNFFNDYGYFKAIINISPFLIIWISLNALSAINYI